MFSVRVWVIGPMLSVPAAENRTNVVVVVVVANSVNVVVANGVNFVIAIGVNVAAAVVVTDVHSRVGLTLGFRSMILHFLLETENWKGTIGMNN